MVVRESRPSIGRLRGWDDVAWFVGDGEGCRGVGGRG